MQNRTVFPAFFLVLSGCVFAMSDASAQPAAKEKHLLFSIFNAATQLPVGEFLPQPMHPGATAGMEFRYNRQPKNQWFQTARLGFSHHRYVQSSLQLYSEAGFRRAIWRGIAAEFRLGTGYLHAIPATEIFSLNGGVREKKTNFGRPQIMAGGAFGLSYALQKGVNPWRFSLDYQFYLQLPFVRQYVTLLPNTLLHLGIAAPISILKK